MPAKSRKQQRLMGMARAIQKGELSPRRSPEAARIAKTMSPEDLEEFASTPLKGLPERKSPRVKKVDVPQAVGEGRKVRREAAPPEMGPPLSPLEISAAGRAPAVREKEPRAPQKRATPKRTMAGILRNLARQRRVK